MRRACVVAGLCAVFAVLVGCSWYQAPVMPPYGSLFADISAPMTVDYEGQAVAPAQGQASAKSVLGLIAWGDCGVQTAAQNGRLSKISYCDYEYLNVLGFYQSFTVVAHGE
jgi:hypothetical protein